MCECGYNRQAGREGGRVFAAEGEWKAKTVSGKCTWIASHQLPICYEAAVTGKSLRGAGQQQTERKTISGANNLERQR